MAPDALVFALANPAPEIDPEEAEDYAAVVATGRSDYPNQINNVLAFPGSSAARSTRARDDHAGMKIAAAHAIAVVDRADELSPDYIVPSVFDRTVAPAVEGRRRGGPRRRRLTAGRACARIVADFPHPPAAESRCARAAPPERL